MHIHEHMALQLAKWRIQDAVRSAEQRRALRLARASRPSARIRLGMALVRFGQWIQGEPSPASDTSTDPLRMES